MGGSQGRGAEGRDDTCIEPYVIYWKGFPIPHIGRPSPTLEPRTLASSAGTKRTACEWLREVVEDLLCILPCWFIHALHPTHKRSGCVT